MAAVSTLALAGVLALAACGSDNTQSASTGSATGSSGSSAADCATGTLNGEGSSAQKNAVDEVARTYQQKCPDAKINYNPTGSGAGIKQFNAGQVDFAGSDSALKTDEADGAARGRGCKRAAAAWNLPMVTGPDRDRLQPRGRRQARPDPRRSLAKIFNGKITTWNDPAIAAVNAGVTLPADPDQGVLPLRRVGHHGELHQVPERRGRRGQWTAEARPRSGPASGEGKEKSAGVADGVKSAPRAASPTSSGRYAKDNKLGIAQIDNGAGPVELTGASRSARPSQRPSRPARATTWRCKLDYATKEAGAYPILLVTYEIVCSQGPGRRQDHGRQVVPDALRVARQPEAPRGARLRAAAQSIEDKVVAAIDAIA